MRSSAAEEPCAAKVLALAGGTFADMVEDFGREVDLMRQLGTLRHPCLVNFIGAGSILAPPELGPWPGVASGAGVDAYVLCIELCDLSLDGVVGRRRAEARPFSSQELGPVLANVSSGLAYLHERRILHRDLKAANVFLQRRRGSAVRAEEGPTAPDDTLPNYVSEPLELAPNLTDYVAKLGDFGASKAASRAQTPVQTPQWMAPEAMRQEPYGPASDMWSLGMLMYELIELGIPYGEEITMPELEAAVCAGRPPALTQLGEAQARVPDILPLMQRCLAADAAARPSAAALAGALAGLGWPAVEAQASAASGETAASVEGEAAAKKKRRKGKKKSHKRASLSAEAEEQGLGDSPGGDDDEEDLPEAVQQPQFVAVEEAKLEALAGVSFHEVLQN